jgi:hypothetical protein
MTKTYRNVQTSPDGLIRGEYSWKGGPWCSFTGREDLLWIEMAMDRGGNTAVAAIWARQDGYGEPGYTPPQGFDWSGIRDSSDEATARMVAVASEFLSEAEFLSALGIT